MLDAFVTFGLPAIALAGTAFALYAQGRATKRLQEGLDRDQS